MVEKPGGGVKRRARRSRLVRVTVDDEGATTSASLLEPAGAVAMFVLAHGAGSTREHESLVLLQEALAERKVATLAFNFAYSEAGRRRPDPMARLERAYRGALAFARKELRRFLFAGGRSLGGRVATHLAAAGERLDGLILLGYPLHPSGDTSKLRDAHLPDIRCPALFLSGTRDRLADPDLLEDAVFAMESATLSWVEGADHGLDVRGRSRAEVASELAQRIVEWIPA